MRLSPKTPKAVCAVLINTPKAETINARLEDVYAQNKAAIHSTL